MSENPYNTPTTKTPPPSESGNGKYQTYSEVPYFRKQWFFWLCWLFFAPIALIILFTGDVYYVKKGKVVTFGIINKIIGVIFGVIWIIVASKA